jgi:hypothetical protein
MLLFWVRAAVDLSEQTVVRATSAEHSRRDAEKVVNDAMSSSRILLLTLIRVTDYTTSQ